MSPRNTSSYVASSITAPIPESAAEPWNVSSHGGSIQSLRLHHAQEWSNRTHD